MVIANKRSFDARLYINDKVNEMKEQLKNVTDEGAKKQLLENFKALKSSEEYQKKLGIVAKDTKELKDAFSNPTAEKVQLMKEKFYGKIGTYLGSEDFETFEEIENVADRIEFLFKKLGDGDETLSCILDPRWIIDPENKDGCYPRRFMGPFMGPFMGRPRDNRHEYLEDFEDWYRDNGGEHFEALYRKKHDKFERDFFDYEKWISENLYNNKFHNLSLRMAKEVIRSDMCSDLILRNPGAFSKDVFKDEKIIKFFKRTLELSGNKDFKRDNIFYKMGKEGRNYLLQTCSICDLENIINNLQGTKILSENFIKNLIRNALNKENRSMDPSNFSHFIKSGRISCKPLISYQKEIAYGAINTGVSEAVKENINYFTQLTDDEKNEILGKIAKNLTANISGNGELVENLVDSRKEWKKRINLCYNQDIKIKEQIVTASRKIKVKLELDSDGESRLIKFKLGNKSYTILDPELRKHSDRVFRDERQYATRDYADVVKLGGMMGDNVDDWENKMLKKYVKEKEKEGLHIASEQEIKNLLKELGNLAGIKEEEYKERYGIAMLMYLTGMNGCYWLSMSDPTSRSMLYCYFGHPEFEQVDLSRSRVGASLFMLSSN